MLMTRFVSWMLLAGLMIMGTGVVSGQDYPNKTIRIVTGGVGGSNDFLARIIAQGISGPLGQPVIIENRGTGLLSGETASKAPPDGYTLLVAGSSFWTGILFRKTPYDPIMDFSPITIVAMEPDILVVHPALPVKSVKELIALARTRPGELNYSAASLSGSSYLAAELFKSMAGVNIVQVNYKGSAQELADLIAGQVHLSFQSGTKMKPHIKSGKLKALAVSSAQPSVLAPDLPTVAATVRGFESISVNAVFAPAKTPPAIINRLNQEIVRFIKTTETKERLFNAGTEIVGSSPEETAGKIKSEMVKLSKLIKDLGIKANR